jgi:type IV pilus assembly protein PilQ
MNRLIIALIFYSLGSLPIFAQTSEILGISFNQENEISKLEIVLNSNIVEAQRFHVTEDKQIIIDIENVGATERVMRAFDTSEFSGSVVFVSAYRKPGSPRDIRIALQLRDNVRSLLKREPNRIILEIENRFGAFSNVEIQANKGSEDVLTTQTPTTATEAEVGRVNVPKSESVEDILDNLTQSGRKRYVGRRITLNVREISVGEILKMIAEASGFNIITTSEIQTLPPLTLNLTNIPWDQALDTILGLNKLVATKNGMILMVTSLEKATADAEAAAKARSLAQDEEPLVTKVFPISFSSLEDISVIMEDYLTPERGKISRDERTNSLIVKDTVDVMERIRRIIEALDLQTPQVMIESKIVEVTEQYSKEIGLQTGLQFGYDPVGVKAPPAGTGTDLDSIGPGFVFSSAPTSDTGFFGLEIGRFGRLANLGFQLQMLEQESKAKIISSPKVITQNKQSATILSNDETSFTRSTTSGGQTDVAFEKESAELKLEVTPQVTNEGSISLEISLTKEQFIARPLPGAPPDKQSRSIETNVLIDNGATIVLGGVYNFETSESHSGVPFLKDIPLVGWLFRTPYNPTIRKNELVIFMTPRIINQEEAGLSDRG